MSIKKVGIYKDKNPSRKKPWLVRWYGEYGRDGDQKRSCRAFRTRAQAERYQRIKQTEFDNGECRDIREINLGQLCEQFLENRKHTLRHSSLTGYNNTINQLLEFFSPSRNINRITRQQAEEFISTRKIIHPDHIKKNKKLSAWQRNSHHKHANAIFNAAVSWEYIKKNPFTGIKLATPTKRQWHYFTPDEFQALLNKTPTLRLRCLYGVMYGTGLRYGEAINLLWNGRDIDFEKNKINVNNRQPSPDIPHFFVKDHEDRSISMPKWLSTMLTELHTQSPENCPFIFVTLTRLENLIQKWHKFYEDERALEWQNKDVCNNVLRNFRTYCSRSGISTNEKLTLHCLRKSFAQNLADAGTPVFTLKKLMGHSSIAVTEQFYLRSTDANEEKACAVLDKIMNKQMN